MSPVRVPVFDLHLQVSGAVGCNSVLSLTSLAIHSLLPAAITQVQGTNLDCFLFQIEHFAELLQHAGLEAGISPLSAVQLWVPQALAGGAQSVAFRILSRPV